MSVLRCGLFIGTMTYSFRRLWRRDRFFCCGAAANRFLAGLRVGFALRVAHRHNGVSLSLLFCFYLVFNCLTCKFSDFLSVFGLVVSVFLVFLSGVFWCFFCLFFLVFGIFFWFFFPSPSAEKPMNKGGGAESQKSAETPAAQGQERKNPNC